MLNLGTGCFDTLPRPQNAVDGVSVDFKQNRCSGRGATGFSGSAA